jgi:hypothetical protein
MPTHHSPSTLQSPLRHLHTGSGSSHGGSPVFVAAKPRQANRCWPRAYLIPPGIILILVSHAFDPNPRYRAPVTLLLPLWARRSKDDCARSSCRHYIHPPCSSATRAHRTLARNESNRRPGRGGPLPSARRRKKQHCSRQGIVVARHLLRCCWICTCCHSCQQTTTTNTREAHRKGEGSEGDSWSAGIKCDCRRSSSSTAAQQHSTAQRGLGAQSSSAACFPLGVRHSSSCPSASTLTCSPSQVPSRLASNATHNHPRPHPRLHRPRCSSARSQRPLRIAHNPSAPHRTAPPPTDSPRPRRARTSSCRPRVCAAVANNARRKPSASVRAHPPTSPSRPLRRVESSATGA